MIEIHLNCHGVLEIAYLTMNNDSGVRHSVLNLTFILPYLLVRCAVIPQALD